MPLASREEGCLGESIQPGSVLLGFSWLGHVHGEEQKATLMLFVGDLFDEFPPTHPDWHCSRRESVQEGAVGSVVPWSREVL